MTIGEAKVASPEEVASQGEAIVLVLPLEANLALSCRASLLALSHALLLASRQSILAHGAESDARSATLLARTGALILASHVTGLTLPNSVIEASGAAVASL